MFTAEHSMFTFKNNVFVIEASDLKDTSFDGRKLRIKGHNSTVQYEIVDAVRDNEGDIIKWVYLPSTKSMMDTPACRGTKVEILND